MVRYTIAIPTHNNFSTIKRCIESAVNLNFKDYEIVISDTSTDEETWDYIKEKSNTIDNFKIYRNDLKWNMWENHNFCLNQARGEYVLFIHSDDVLLEDALTIIDGHLNKLSYPKKIVAWGRSLYKDYNEVLKNNNLPLETLICGKEALSLFLSGGLTPSGTLVSKSFIELGGYLNDNMIPPYSDCISMINCGFNGYKFYMYNDIIFLRTMNGTQFKKIKKAEVISMYNLLKEYFTMDKIQILIDLSFEYKSFEIIKFFFVDKQIAKLIRRILTRKVLRRPYKFLDLRYIRFILIKYKYLRYK